MAQLDRFLEVLVQRGAHALRLVSGQSPAFVFPEGERPASQAQPSLDQLLVLLGEIVEPELIARAQQTGAAEGQIQRPALPLIRVHLEFEGAQLTAIFTAGVAVPQPPATPPPRPAATVSPPVAAPVAATVSPPVAAPTASTTSPTRAAAGASAIDALLRLLVEAKGSDLHLSSGEVPMLRKDGEVQRIEGQELLTPARMRELIDPIMPERNRAEYEEIKDTDFAHEIRGLARFRGNLFMDRKGPGAVFRVIPSKILTAEQLGLSAAILELCKLTKGLVLVTGPTGSGKSTTLTAMIDHINSIRSDHIITIEDPIEFVHDNRRCLINQREVSVHTSSFKRALKAALREDPDIVLVGEMRDLETISIAIETAETGHLVFGTLHTTTAVSTVDRIIDQFPADRQSQVRTMLSESLKGVIAQTLCKKIGGGRVAALEVLLGIPSVSNLIREGKTFQIPSIMQTARKHGMVTLNDALMELVKKQLIAPEEAYLKAVDKSGMAAALKSVTSEAGFLVGA